MTERPGGSDLKLSPTTAKVMLTVAAVAGTLGGWAVLAGREAPSAQTEAAVPPISPSEEGLPSLVEISVAPQALKPSAAEPSRATRESPLRVVNQAPPRPITLTRSSR